MATRKKRETTNYIVVHQAATRPSMDIGVEEIDRWHRERGWFRIGYHYVIRRDGSVEEGEELERHGAHVRTNNHDSIGICLAGGVSEEDHTKPEFNFTDAQMASLLELIFKLQDDYGYGEAEVCGHADLDGAKPYCPGFNAAEFVKDGHYGEDLLTEGVAWNPQ